MKVRSAFLAACLAVTGFGQGRSRPHFEVASVRPSPPNAPRAHGNHGWGWDGPIRPSGEYVDETATVYSLLTFAYPGEFAVNGLPQWAKFGGDRFSVDAKPAPGPRPTIDALRLMMRTLLADRFALRVHETVRTGPVFLLVRGKTASTQLERAAPGDRPAPPFFIFQWTRVDLYAHSVTISELAASLGRWFGRPVVDSTGLAGRYSINIPPEVEPAPPRGQPSLAPADMLRRFLPAQLGLDLRPGTGPIKVLVLDRLQHPSSN